MATTSANQSATQRVLETTELLEEILLELGDADLRSRWHAQYPNHYVKTTIAKSPRLQQQLLYRVPVHDPAKLGHTIEPNPLFNLDKDLFFNSSFGTIRSPSKVTEFPTHGFCYWAVTRPGTTFPSGDPQGYFNSQLHDIQSTRLVDTVDTMIRFGPNNTHLTNPSFAGEVCVQYNTVLWRRRKNGGVEYIKALETATVRALSATARQMLLVIKQMIVERVFDGDWTGQDVEIKRWVGNGKLIGDGPEAEEAVGLMVGEVQYRCRVPIDRKWIG